MINWWIDTKDMGKEELLEIVELVSQEITMEELRRLYE